MTASITNPVYSTNLIKANGTKYRLKGITTDLSLSHSKDELAEKVEISIVNVKAGTKRIREIISLKDKIYVYANTGSGSKTVFAGYVWEKQGTHDASSDEVKLVCYNRPIYLHNCKDCFFFKKGKKTKDVITSIAKKWGFKISYKYRSITHSKLVYQSETIADIIIDILEKVKKKTGVGYVIRFENNVLVIESEGSNKTVYKIESKKNSIATSYRETMEGMVTKVKIVKAETVKKKDSEEESGKYLTVTNIKKNTTKYGTLQDIVIKEKEEKLSEAKKEANEILKEHAKPTIEIEIEAVDNPLVKKGHKIYVISGHLKNYYIVKGIEHNTKDNTMYLEVEKA